MSANFFLQQKHKIKERTPRGITILKWKVVASLFKGRPLQQKREANDF